MSMQAYMAQANSIYAEKISRPKQDLRSNGRGETVSNSGFLDMLKMLSSETLKTASTSKNNNYNSFKDNFQSASTVNKNTKINAIKKLASEKDVNSTNLAKISSSVSSGENVSGENKIANVTANTNVNEKDLTALDETVNAVIKDKAAGNIDDVQIDVAQLLQLLGVPLDAIAQVIADFNNENIIDIGNGQAPDMNSLLTLTAPAPVSTELNSNNVNSIDSFMVSIKDAMQILNEFSEVAELPVQNKQIISELAGNFQNIINVAEMDSESPLTDFKSLITDNVKESILALQNQNTTISAISNQPANISLANRITSFLEANNIDTRELREVTLEVSEENQTQNIRDIVNAMRSTKIIPAAVSEKNIQVPVINNNFIREDILLTQNPENSSVETNETEAQNKTLIQMANEIRQFSTATVNEIIAERFASDNANNANVIANNTADTNSTDAMNDTNEISNSLSGIVDVRNSAVTNNSSQQQQVVELKTHIANAVNEISNMVAKNRAGGNFELKMKLAPEALGEVLVKVTYNKGNVNLNIITENRAAEVQLVNQVETLKESLASHSFSLTEFDISTGTGSEFDANYNQQRENTNNSRNYQNTFSKTDDNLSDTDNVQNVQRLANLYMKRIMYKTI